MSPALVPTVGEVGGFSFCLFVTVFSSHALSRIVRDVMYLGWVRVYMHKYTTLILQEDDISPPPGWTKCSESRGHRTKERSKN